MEDRKSLGGISVVTNSRKTSKRTFIGCKHVNAKESLYMFTIN